MNPFNRVFGGEARDNLAIATIPTIPPIPTAPTETSPTEISPTEAIQSDTFSVSPALTSALQDVLAKIEGYKAINTPHNKAGKKQRFSSRIILGKQTDIMPLVCSETGSVAALLFPAIPSKTLIYRSPLAVFSNAKGIALEGPAYLRQLDAQTLAAVLLTLAREYDLFRSAPSDTGTQKNAILRTVDRDTLIDAVILIAEHIHEANCVYLPKLSLILDVEVADRGIHIRMQNWLKVLTDLIYRPTAEAAEETSWDHPAPYKQIAIPTIAKANREKIALKKEFRAWAKTSKETIAAIAAKGSISLKLKSFLLAVLTEDTITAADPTLISLMCQKLESLNLFDATKLSFGLKKYHEAFNAVAQSEEFSSPSFASKAPGTPIVDASEEDNEFGTTAAKIEVAAFQAALEPKAQDSTTPRNDPIPSTGAVSFAERIRLIKAAKEAAAVSVVTESPIQEDQDAPF